MPPELSRPPEAATATGATVSPMETGAALSRKVRALVRVAGGEGRTHLTEAEALDLLDLLGVPTPRRFLAAADGSFDPGQLASLEASKVYVKAVSPGLLHKSEAGAVASCAASQDALQGTLAAMARRTRNLPVTGFLVEEAVAVPPVLGAELLFSLRFTPDFGPVATLALGGVEAELLARETAASRRLAVASPILGPEGAVRSLAASFAGVAATTARRGRPAVAELPAVAAFLTEVLGRQEGSMPDPIAEIEINPLAWTESGPVALDALVRLGAATREPAPPRPLAALQAMVRPRTVAVLGASAHHLNPGRVVVRNLLEAGFPPENLWIVKRDLPALEGCPCFPDLGSLPGPVDLLVLAVGAERLPQLVEEAAAGGKVRGLLLIPGGVSDRGEGAARIRRALSQARAAGRDVVANGPNCLGLRSVPGHCNTLFVPIEKLRFARGGPQPLALISQSGAFAIARSSRLPWMNLRYIVTLGNQLDATCADWLEALAEDPEVAVLGCYVEGFRPLDGVRWLEIARRITEGGRRVVLYRGGRTHAGAQAAASHTASIAGDTEVSLALARSAGVLVAESLEHFEDLLSLAVAWKDKTARGRRLGAVSNAGYECVAIGDGLGRFSLPELSQASLRGIADVLEQKGLGSLVTPGNPLDLTPMADDEGFAEAARRVLEDPGVDLGLVGCVPQTRALETLEPSPVHEEDLHAFGAVAGRLRRLSEETVIPWAAVVDSGSAYDGLALELQRGGVATFRTVDRALAAITPWVEVGLSFLRPLNP